ncbi:MAG: hypothetical protein ACOYNC_03235 [Bacteroidales bacterium]
MNKTKIIVTVVLLILGAFFVVTTCYRSGEKSKAKVLPPGVHGVVVTEVIQTSNYTYLQVQENEAKFWMAIVRHDSKPGDSVYYSQAYEMKQFVSKELNRTFPSIFFVQDPKGSLEPAPEAQQPKTPQKVEIKRWTDVSVTPPKGAITLADLYKNPGGYAGKSVTIRGVIVRYNDQIMNKNWVHLQDGTDFSEKFDLTITTTDKLVLGTTATFTGVISLNKDFGSGYSYDVIMEEAKATDIK